MARHLCQAEILSFSTSENRNHCVRGRTVTRQRDSFGGRVWCEGGDGAAAARLGLGMFSQKPAGPREFVVSSRHHCRASRAASGHLYGLVEWKMLSASLASSFHLEFGRLVPLLDASPPMPRVGFALRCARSWERAQRSTLSGVGELVARREGAGEGRQGTAARQLLKSQKTYRKQRGAGRPLPDPNDGSGQTWRKIGFVTAANTTRQNCREA